MYGFYRSVTYLIAPVMPFWLEGRRKKGKEDGSRLAERFGKASLPRPKGRLLWVHAASVGESNAALPLIKAIIDQAPKLHVLLTTGTVTSASLVKNRMPERSFHQFAPLDLPGAVKDFIEHWQPQMALFIDSELWPNLIVKARKSGAVMGMVNARMSESSYKNWRFAKPLIRTMLDKFTFCFAQSKEDGERLKALGIEKIDHVGNLKYDVPMLGYDAAELERLKNQIGARPVWLAASTHAGEEDMVVDAHNQLLEEFPDLLTIIVPRHAERGEAIAEDMDQVSVARRSLTIPIFPETDIYLADTMGELGLFYRLAQAALIGGSLVKCGGHNPVEALQLGCPIILGPYMDNFRNVAFTIERAEACLRAVDATMLAGEVSQLLRNPGLRGAMAEAGYKHLKMNEGTLQAIVNIVQPSLAV